MIKVGLIFFFGFKDLVNGYIVNPWSQSLHKFKFSPKILILRLGPLLWSLITMKIYPRVFFFPLNGWVVHNLRDNLPDYPWIAVWDETPLPIECLYPELFCNLVLESKEIRDPFNCKNLQVMCDCIRHSILDQFQLIEERFDSENM